MAQRQPAKSKSAAAKKAAATRKANQEAALRELARQAERDKWATWEKRLRDGIIFVVGVGGVANELFLRDEIRPSALIFLASMIGVPFVLAADAKRREP